MKTKIRWSMSLLLILATLSFFVAPVQAQPRQLAAEASISQDNFSTLNQYAHDTWRSFEAMTYPETGLPADNVSAEGVRAPYTSPTNIGLYIWSILSARDLEIIEPGQARLLIRRVLDTLERMERHPASGMYYNWYNPATGVKLTTWPPTGDPVYPFLSSVDNGWLATALIMVTNTVPQLRDRAEAIVDSMDFGFYYDPAAGLLRGGFWVEAPPGCSVLGNYRGRGPDVYYTCHHYGALNTEPRIASYIGIAKDGIPATHYFKMWRTFPDTCDWSWQEMSPEGVIRTYLGVDVYEGHYTYRGMNIVPSWGGSMFEALMVSLVVPEEEWGSRSWGVNHPLYVEAQIEHGLEEAHYGYWGFSPSNDPAGGYREYGIDPIGLNPDGYTSDEERTTVDYGFRDPTGSGYCRPPQPLPESYGQGVVTPHASFLALDFAPDAALQNLANLRRDFESYSWGGFFDAVNVSTGDVSTYYLALDQGMIMAAIANELRNNRLQYYFTRGAIEAAVKPLLQMEEFTAGP
jgi:hypothetical protein